jgi:hypothetical protein
MGIERSGVSGKQFTPAAGSNSLIAKVITIDDQETNALRALARKGVPSMKRHVTLRLCAVFLTALLLTGIVSGQTKQEKSAPAGKTVTGSGCVEAGVEAGCLVLKDTKTGTLFNLFFQGTPPAINTAIRFTGTPHEGPTTCQQGTPVDVKKFTPIQQSCSAPGKAKK